MGKCPKAVLLVQGMSILGAQHEAAQTLQARVLHHRLHKPLAEAAAAVTGDVKPTADDRR